MCVCVCVRDGISCCTLSYCFYICTYHNPTLQPLNHSTFTYMPPSTLQPLNLYLHVPLYPPTTQLLPTCPPLPSNHSTFTYMSPSTLQLNLYLHVPLYPPTTQPLPTCPSNHSTFTYMSPSTLQAKQLATRRETGQVLQACQDRSRQRFPLKDLLNVPIQRFLKYPLLIKVSLLLLTQ